MVTLQSIEDSQSNITEKSPIQRNTINQDNINFQFIETFDNKTYQDASITTAFGWGEGSLSLPMKGIGSTDNLELASSAMDICVSDGFAYIGTIEHGLAIVNISDPCNISTPTYVNVWNEFVVQGVQIVNNFAFLAISRSSPQGGALVVINVSDPLNPSNPVYKGTGYYTRTYGLFVDGNYAYIIIEDTAVHNRKLAIINIESPLSPSDPHYCNISTSNPRDVFIKNNYAYVAISSGLAVIDISDPINPSNPVFFNFSYGVNDIHVRGNYAYLAFDRTGKIGVIDVSDLLVQNDPLNIDIGSVGIPFDIYISGNHAFVGTNSGMWIIFDISNPERPIKLFGKALSHVIYGTQLNQGYGVLANSLGGIAFLNLTETFHFVGDAIAQSFSVYNGGGSIEKVTVNANQNLHSNTSVIHYISFDKNEWFSIEFNQTYSFPNNTKGTLYWRVKLYTEGNQTPSIDSLVINLVISTTETTEPEIPTTFTTTAIPETTILPGQTQSFNFNNYNKVERSITTSLESGTTILVLNNLRVGWELQITVGQTALFMMMNKLQSDVQWTVVDPLGDVKTSVQQSTTETTSRTVSIDKEGSWELRFHWEDSSNINVFDCNIKQAPPSTEQRNPDLVISLVVLIILGGSFCFVLYKTMTDWRHEWKLKAKPISQKIYYTGKGVVEKTRDETPEVEPLRQREESQPTIKKVQVEPIVFKERRSFFCQLDNVQHPKTASGYQCLSCSRMICAECYNKILEVDVPECPFCDGELTKVQ